MFVKITRFLEAGGKTKQEITLNTDNVCYEQPHIEPGESYIRMVDGSVLIVPKTEWEALFEHLNSKEAE
jgi:hypothetical protein